MPQYGKSADSGFDIRNYEHIILRPGRNKIPNGIRLKLPELTEAQLRPRSGNSSKGLPVVTIDTFISKCGNVDGLDTIEQIVAANQDITFTEDELVRIDADVKLGTIDENYRGEVCTTIASREVDYYILVAQTRIAQLVIAPVLRPRLVQGHVSSDTERADNGHGSTGVL